MISQLNIKNIALIDDLSIGFHEGLNILTGETGAGKSIIIDAVNLVLGERADRDLIQTGKEFGRVEILFSNTGDLKLDSLLGEYGIETEPDHSLLLIRELTSQGKNICRVNGRTVTLTMLREISRHLVDIHGQHQHQSLLSPESHIQLLDRLGGQALLDEKKLLKHTFHQWQSVDREIRKITGLEKDGERRKDLLRYQIDEITTAGLSIGEEANLKKERTLLSNAEKIIKTLNEAYEKLYTGQVNRPSISDDMGNMTHQISQIQGFDEGLDSIAKLLENIQYQLEDAVLQLRQYKDFFEYDPYRLEEIESRLECLHNLKRKYGGTIEEVLSYQLSLEEELTSLENSQERLEELMIERKEFFERLICMSTELSQKRVVCGNKLSSALLNQLKDLGMGKTSFEVDIKKPEGDLNTISGFLTENGYDTVEFLISPNPGEPLKPLAKIISGGEMSRIMLAFKAIIGHLDGIPTLIFDEIDVGISGRTAQAVAEKMGVLSSDCQIICVTHLPQIASMADNHYIIKKIIDHNKTSTTVERMNFTERQKEVARMLGGAAVTQLSLDHAAELIETAEQFKEANKTILALS